MKQCDNLIVVAVDRRCDGIQPVRELLEAPCITNTPDVLTEDTADLTIALMLAAARRLPEGCQMVKDNLWRGWAPTFLLGTSLTNKKLGIIGLG